MGDIRELTPAIYSRWTAPTTSPMPDTAHFIPAEDPRDAGFYMPAEWAPHDCCWMAWPCRDGHWPDAPATMQDYANVAHAISRFEPVKMLVPAMHMADAQRYLGDAVDKA